jgi:hypothetical protein
LEKDGKDFKARELAEAELQEHYEAITAAESVLKDFRTLTRAAASPSSESAPPEPPTESG